MELIYLYDEEYKNSGVNFLDNENEIVKNSEIVVQLGLPNEEKNII